MTERTIHKHFSELPKQAAKRFAEVITEAEAMPHHSRIDIALGFADGVLNGFGIESIRDDGWSDYYLDLGLLYVNLGDPYEKTLMYDTRTKKFIIGAWGDYIDTPSKIKRFIQS
jgi:hypothetical protein